AVAWFLELYPGLGRRRALALRIALIQRADTAGHLLNMESATSSGLLDSITADLAQARVDLWQNAESHYFTEEAPEDFAGLLRARFIPRGGDGTDAILQEYARQHRQQAAP